MMFILSWQPITMTPDALKKAQEIAKSVTDGLGGRGIFGVEFFVKDNEVYFSELSPRPHDTGMVTLLHPKPKRICPACKSSARTTA